jgi:hypothetical protein
MKRLESNCELYQYLLLLVSKLRERGALDLATLVEFGTKQASGMSTEFLGESRIVLRHLMEREQGILTDIERKEVGDVLKQLDEALDHRPSN